MLYFSALTMLFCILKRSTSKTLITKPDPVNMTTYLSLLLEAVTYVRN